MPKVKRTRKPPPDGWELIEPTLDELDGKMREGEGTQSYQISSCFVVTSFVHESCLSCNQQISL